MLSPLDHTGRNQGTEGTNAHESRASPQRRKRPVQADVTGDSYSFRTRQTSV